MAEDRTIELAETFGRVARELLQEPDVDRTLERVVRLAERTLDACEHAGITMVEGGRIESRVRTDDCPAVLDALQDELREGPCYDAIREESTFRTGKLSAEERWPRFSRRAAEETGVESVLAVRLFADAQTMGALNLYSTQPEAFTDADVALATVFAAHAAVAMQHDREVESLQAAVASRDLIGQAKGILMERKRLTEAQAFEQLKRASQHLNMKLRDVAARVTETGESPE